MDVSAWLIGLGLEQYAPAFHDNDVDGELLPELTADDLIAIGVTSVGHRRKLLAAIAALGEPPSAVQSAASAAPAPVSPPTIDAERRQLTVMFCDLVGSTALSTRHDPEDLRELIGDYHGAVSEAVGRFDGFVAKYMGDGVLIYFGYPQAHEDDAERAVRAGLAVIEAVGKLPSREDLSVRLGVATGLAVVGDLIGEGAAQERGVIGETPNLAARLQGLAAPDTLIIGDATRRQIGGLFDLEDLGPQQLAGFAEPQRAWRVQGESGAVSRFEALRSGETPLVGRDEEVELLTRRWQQAKSGEGRLVLISGEPGIGKSRLAAALSEHIENEPHTRLRYFCSPHHQDSALHPFVAQFERAAGFARDDTVDAKLGKLRALLAPGAQDEHDLALLSELLSLPSTAADHDLSPQRKREKLFGALLNQLEVEARHHPVLMVFEDAHWIDPTSRELLDMIVDRVRRLPVLLAITFRPEFQPPWAGRAHVTSLALDRLSERAGEALVHTLAGDAGLTADMIAEIVERTDGVPLFVEELTKAVLESAGQGDRIAAVLGTASPAVLSVPATLHASLMARLDRLGPAAREIAQIGAVIGREFTYELIDPVARRPDLVAALAQLSHAGLLFCRGVPPHASYLFKHALVQDAAYDTLLRSRRRGMHARTAAVLEQHFPEIAETQPEILARHHTQAGHVGHAIGYWQRAGERALGRSANLEATKHLARAIELIASLPPATERDRRELSLNLALGSAARTLKGHAAADTVRAFSRARDLLDEHSSVQEHVTVHSGLWSIHFGRAEHRAAREVAQQAMTLAERHGTTVLLALAHRLMGATSWATGTFEDARDHFEKTLALCAPGEGQVGDLRLSHDYAVSASSLLAETLLPLGYPAQATAALAQARDRAQSTGHAMTIALALFVRAEARLAYGAAPVGAATDADEAARYCSEHHVAIYQNFIRFLQGIACTHGGDPRRGIEVMGDAMAAAEKANVLVHRPMHLGHLATAHASLGGEEVGLTRLDEALGIVDGMEERVFEAELYRVRGELLLGLGRRSEAEAALQQALAVARRQHARLWELRAAMSLARLWRDQGRRDDSRDLLTPVYAWFTEGFDNPDLQDAEALLAELGALSISAGANVPAPTARPG